MKIKSESPAPYIVTTGKVSREDAVIAEAMQILQCRLSVPGAAMSTPNVVKDYLCLKLAQLEHEVFSILFLNVKNELIAYSELFRGTLTQANVFPREVVKEALKHNCHSVIFAHNHPSGACEPSRSDKLLTESLRSALALVDVRVLDHIIVGGMGVYSFAECGDL